MDGVCLHITKWLIVNYGRTSFKFWTLWDVGCRFFGAIRARGFRVMNVLTTCPRTALRLLT